MAPCQGKNLNVLYELKSDKAVVFAHNWASWSKCWAGKRCKRRLRERIRDLWRKPWKENGGSGDGSGLKRAILKNNKVMVYTYTLRESENAV